MAESPWVNIRHADGREYQIRESDFDKDNVVMKDPTKQERFREPELVSFKAAGFKIAGRVGDEPAQPAAARRATEPKAAEPK